MVEIFDAIASFRDMVELFDAIASFGDMVEIFDALHLLEILWMIPEVRFKVKGSLTFA